MHRAFKKTGAAVLLGTFAAGAGLTGPGLGGAAQTVPKVDLATAVCRGIAGCTPVVSGWVAVPGGSLSNPGSTQTSVGCQGDAIAANLGATSPSGSVSVDVNAMVEILNGIPYGRSFDAINSGGASTFQAAVGCVDIASGSVSGTETRTSGPTDVAALSPGEKKDYTLTCPDGQVAVDGKADVAFDSADPPSVGQIGEVSFTSTSHGSDFTVTVRTDPGLNPDDHAELQLRTDCRTGS